MRSAPTGAAEDTATPDILANAAFARSLRGQPVAEHDRVLHDRRHAGSTTSLRARGCAAPWRRSGASASIAKPKDSEDSQDKSAHDNGNHALTTRDHATDDVAEAAA